MNKEMLINEGVDYVEGRGNLIYRRYDLYYWLQSVILKDAENHGFDIDNIIDIIESKVNNIA